MALCIMVIARVAFIPLWMKSKPWAGFFSNSYPCFCGPWSILALYQLCWKLYFRTYLLPLYLSNSVCNNFYSYSDDEMYLWTLCNMWHVCWILYDLGCCNRLSRPVVVLDGLPGLYGFKYDSATACGLLLYLYSYKLVGSATAGIRARFNVSCHKCI